MTNLRDAFRGHSRSQNMVSFEMLGMVTSYAIVTVFFPMFDFKKCRDLEIRVRGHSRSLKVAQFVCMVSKIPISVFSNIVSKTHHFWDIRLQKCRDLETRVRVTQGLRK